MVAAINLTIVFGEIVKFAPNNYFHTFAPPFPAPLDSLNSNTRTALTPTLGQTKSYAHF